MSVRYQRRINLGKGLGVNLSKSGMSVSKRTTFGSIGTSGYSIKTGVPGLFFRKYSGKNTKSKAKDIALILLIIGLISAFVYFVLYFLKALFLLIFHYTILAIRWSKKQLLLHKAKKDVESLAHRKDVLFVKFEHASLPDDMKNTKVFVKELLVKNNQQVSKHQEIALIHNGTYTATLSAETSGKITFYISPETSIRSGAYLYRVDE